MGNPFELGTLQRVHLTQASDKVLNRSQTGKFVGLVLRLKYNFIDFDSKFENTEAGSVK